MKYPGGYQIIDLGGILIKESEEADPPVRVKGLFYKIQNSKKPVILTNFSLSGDAVPKAPNYGVRIAASADDDTEFYSEALPDSSNITIIHIQGSNPPIESENNNIFYTCHPYYTE